MFWIVPKLAQLAINLSTKGLVLLILKEVRTAGQWFSNYRWMEMIIDTFKPQDHLFNLPHITWVLQCSKIVRIYQLGPKLNTEIVNTLPSTLPIHHHHHHHHHKLENSRGYLLSLILLLTERRKFSKFSSICLLLNFYRSDSFKILDNRYLEISYP